MLSTHSNVSASPEEHDDAEIGAVTSDDPRAKHWKPAPPDPVPCPYCGKPQYFAGWYHGKGMVQWYKRGGEQLPIPCSCKGMQNQLQREKEQQEEERQKQIEDSRRQAMIARVKKITGESGMSSRFLKRRFDTFKVTADNERAFNACKRYADKFNECMLPTSPNYIEKNGLVLMGSVGTGKTHLASAIANQLLETGTAVICMTMIDLLSRIRQTYDKRNPDIYTESSILDTYVNVPLLIIDDMGKEQATEWASQTIFSIINARYEKELPVIITTNYPLNELVKRMTPKNATDGLTAQATLDRLHETCSVLILDGKSMR